MRPLVCGSVSKDGRECISMPHSSSPNIPHTDSGGVFWFDQPAPANGKKNDQGKARYDLLPWKAVTQVVAVLEFGAYVKNYGPDNWRQVKEWRRRYFSAACRHLISWTLGEQLDAESGLPHLAHAACCVLFMLELDV